MTDSGVSDSMDAGGEVNVFEESENDGAQEGINSEEDPK